jgi:hypothetical protein
MEKRMLTAQTNGSSTGPEVSHDADALLAFQAPYLTMKLVRLGVADSEAQAAQLFAEVKKYLALVARDPEREVPMFSTRVDQVWHEFVLFTREYAEFCARHAGRFLHHAPLEAAPRAGAARRPPLTFEEFRGAYEGYFGALSPLWLDELALTPETRLGWSSWGAPLVVSREGDHAVLRRDDPSQVLCKVSARAMAALAFIAEHRFFLVRELPGLRADDERLELCRPLVEFRLLTLG